MRPVHIDRYDLDGWWQGEGRDGRQSPVQLWRNWPTIEHHPRIPWDGRDELVRQLIERMCDGGQPFTVLRRETAQ